MNANKIIAAAALSLGLFQPAARADLVTDWNTLALNAIRAGKTPPPLAARNLAILHAAIFDACNGISQNCQAYLVTNKAPGVASETAAISIAARLVMTELFPAQQAFFDSACANAMAQVPEGPGRDAGVAWGETVADAMLRWRSADGSAEVVRYEPGSGPGVWIPTPPGFLPALFPNWPLVVPFAMTNGAQFRPPPPPLLDSAAWAFDFNLTRTLGRFDSSARTADQTQIALFWADGAGTVTPPGHWNVIAQEVAARRGNTLEQNARLFALLNLAEADAGIVAWDCKYAYNSWRPVTAIPNADSDGNLDTTSDATWTPLLITPNFPEYISGHSTFSGAAATVLAAFFGSDTTPFTTGSEALPGVLRSFESFSQAAQEAGISRIYGGIHFMSANEHGLACGAHVGAYVAGNFLLPKPGRSQRGH